MNKGDRRRDGARTADSGPPTDRMRSIRADSNVARRGGQPPSTSRVGTPGGPRLRVTVSDELGRRVAAAGLDRWLAGVAPARAGGAVNIAIVSDSRVRALNRQYLGRDYATDVLSFPGSAPDRREPVDRTTANSPASLGPSLGEIVIARGVARRQARDARHSHSTELRVLALHGLLHLLGYDHERDGGVMAGVERRLRTKGGLRAGLIERTRMAPGRMGGET
jgi:probable rRNA maturation factor